MVIHSHILKMLFVNIPSRSINLSARLRFPLIKFRYGPAREQHQKPETAATTASTKSPSQTVQSTEPIYDFQLPLRFRRKPLGEEEIEFINRGGPA